MNNFVNIRMLNPSKIENYSGGNSSLGKIRPIRRGAFCKVDIAIQGDAPKDFIRVYEFESGVRKSSRKTWPQYIAKVGHKWYPVESISEQLMTRIGQLIGLNIADSKLMMAGRQLRFLSRYFLRKDESLVHGAEIFAGYLGGDQVFTDEIERRELARELFTFQFAEKAIASMFPSQKHHILEDFVKMLVFDAITGNNDRHFYNWGVVTHLKGKKSATFAPIYDTARGLFWNNAEAQIVQYLSDKKQLDVRLLKYAENSLPKTGWDGLEKVNHFSLINKIYHADGRYQDTCRRLIESCNLKEIGTLIDDEFAELLSHERREIIKRYLALRINKLKDIINKT